MKNSIAAITLMLLPVTAGALSIQSESDAGCLVVDRETQAGMDQADRNITVQSACDGAHEWQANPETVAAVAAVFADTQMCLTVDFRRSLQGQGETFNVFAAADCQKALFWEIRNGFIVAEVAATVYCLEAAPATDDAPANAIARIGCSGEDTSVWLVD